LHASIRFWYNDADMTNQTRNTRLVKILLPADLIREMDIRILGSGGAYQDRNEFVSEAIRDRLAEEAALDGDEPESTPPARHRKPSAPRIAEELVGYVAPDLGRAEEPMLALAIPATPKARGDQLYLGDWQRGNSCTVPAQRSERVSFGLHNRDFPTLWALNRLATMTGRDAVGWDQFLAVVREEGAGVGERLRLHDLEAGHAIPIGIGFPKPGAKRDASIERFVNAMLGTARRADGPLFDLALIGFADEAREKIAPTDAGLDALGDMVDRGLGTDLPQPPAAFKRWWQHLSEWVPAERAAWHKVLRVAAEATSRDELVAAFPEWRGHTATTNTVGFIGRSREWGLMQPELHDGRYLLTELGQMVAREG
jgi:hypothetical protein